MTRRTVEPISVPSEATFVPLESVHTALFIISSCTYRCLNTFEMCTRFQKWHFLVWQSPEMNITLPYWWPSGNKPSPEPMLTQTVSPHGATKPQWVKRFYSPRYLMVRYTNKTYDWILALLYHILKSHNGLCIKCHQAAFTSHRTGTWKSPK